MPWEPSRPRRHRRLTRLAIIAGAVMIALVLLTDTSSAHPPAVLRVIGTLFGLVVAVAIVGTILLIVVKPRGESNPSDIENRP